MNTTNALPIAPLYPGFTVVPLPTYGIPRMAGAVGLRYNRIPALVPPFTGNNAGLPLVTTPQLVAHNWIARP